MREALSYDTETTGLDLYTRHEMFAYSICTEDGSTSVYRADAGLSAFRRKLSALWCQPNRPLVMHNAKFDITATRRAGITIDEAQAFHDTFFMAHILQSTGSHKLKDLAHTLAGVVFWSEYAPPGMSPIIYSIIYNGSYMLPEIIISGVFVYALMKRGILEMNL